MQSVFILACSIGAPLTAAAQSSASAAGRFDGNWQGRATSSAGTPGCPIVLDFRVLFSGDKFAGIATSGGDRFALAGELAGSAKIEFMLFNSVGLATFAVRFRDGAWQGSWEAEGECDGAWSLERVK